MSPATMTLAVPKRPAEKRLPKATEILSMARSAPRSDEVSPASVAAAKSQSAVRKKKTARKPPPWYKILIANAVLFAIVYGAYCTWHSHEDEALDHGKRSRATVGRQQAPCDESAEGRPRQCMAH